MNYVFGVFRNYNLLVGTNEEGGNEYENLDELIKIFKDGRDAQHYADIMNEAEQWRDPYGFSTFYHVEKWDVE